MQPTQDYPRPRLSGPASSTRPRNHSFMEARFWFEGVAAPVETQGSGDHGKKAPRPSFALHWDDDDY